MKQVEKYSSKRPLTALKSSVQNLLSAYSGVFGSKPKSESKDHTVSANRYSVLYRLKSQYHHVGCSSQAEAQAVLAKLMTDENRVPVGIYDASTDSFEWELIGQYFHRQDSASEQQSRLNEVLVIARALRRRDSSWQAGYMQRPSFFA